MGPNIYYWSDSMNHLFREVWKSIYFRRDKNVNFPTHVHDEIELVYVFEGGGNGFCDGKQYTLKPNSIFISFPEQIHSFSDCVDGEYILLVISPSRLLYHEAFFRRHVPTSALTEGSPELAQLLNAALAAFESKMNTAVVYGYLTAFLGKLTESMEFRNATELSSTVSQLLQYCSQHYRERLTLEDLCKALHVSSSHISHIFSNRLKITFPDYMNALRLNQAVLLLQKPGLNMTQVANQAGFPTIRTFNRVFRKQYGCTPLEYRARFKPPSPQK